MAELEEITEVLEETEQTLNTSADVFSADLDVALGDTVTETEWVGNTMKLDLDETLEMTSGVSKEITEEVMPEAAFSSSASELANDVETLLGYPYGEETAAVTTDVAKAAGNISKLETETEASELANKSSKWSKLKMVGKVFMYGTGILLGLDWVAGKLAAIITTSIDADDAPDWAKNMTKAQKDELKNITAALPKMSIIIQSWVSQWKTYKDKDVDFGTLRVTVSSTPHDVPVMFMLFYAFRDMDGVIQNTKDIFSVGTDSLSTAGVIVAMNNIFVVLADALAVFDLKKQSKRLQAYDFPPTADKDTLDKIIMSFKNGEEKVKAVGVKYLRFAATNAITTYLQVKVTRYIYQQLQDIVLPQMREAAKAAFKQAAQAHMDSQKAAIRALAWVPGAGISMARDRISKEQKIAEEEGTAAAKTAAKEKLSELRPQVMAQAKLVAKKKTGVDKKQLKVIADLAIDSALGQVKTAVKT